MSEPIGADARVVEEDVDSSESLDRFPYRGGYGAAVAHVGDERESAHAEAANLGRNGVQLVRGSERVTGVRQLAGHIQRSDVNTLAGERDGAGPTLTVSRSGNQRHFVSKVVVHDALPNDAPGGAVQPPAGESLR